MRANLLSRLVDVGEIRTPSGRALVEERYSALRRQVPVIYVLAIANLCGLELATTGELARSEPRAFAPEALTPDIARTEGWTFGIL